MKIVEDVYIIKGYKDPFNYIDLDLIFKNKDIQPYDRIEPGRCYLRYENNPINFITGYGCNIVSCTDCFWGSFNKETTEEKKLVFDLLKKGKKIKYENR